MSASATAGDAPPQHADRRQRSRVRRLGSRRRRCRAHHPCAVVAASAGGVFGLGLGQVDEPDRPARKEEGILQRSCTVDSSLRCVHDREVCLNMQRSVHTPGGTAAVAVAAAVVVVTAVADVAVAAAVTVIAVAAAEV